MLTLYKNEIAMKFKCGHTFQHAYPIRLMCTRGSLARRGHLQRLSITIRKSWSVFAEAVRVVKSQSFSIFSSFRCLRRKKRKRERRFFQSVLDDAKWTFSQAFSRTLSKACHNCCITLSWANVCEHLKSLFFLFKASVTGRGGTSTD